MCIYLLKKSLLSLVSVLKQHQMSEKEPITVKYIDFLSECDTIYTKLTRKIKKPRSYEIPVMALPGFLCFMTITAFILQKEKKILKEFDVITMAYCCFGGGDAEAVEDGTTAEELKQKEKQLEKDVFYENFKKNLNTFIQKWSKCQWDSVPDGLCSLKYLNECFVKKSASLKPFEEEVLKVEQTYARNMKLLEQAKEEKQDKPEKTCPVCRKMAKLHTCSRCLTIAYCSPDCQRIDWESHKLFCK